MAANLARRLLAAAAVIAGLIVPAAVTVPPAHAALAASSAPELTAGRAHPAHLARLAAEQAHRAHLAHLAHLARLHAATGPATAGGTTGDRVLAAAESRAGDWYSYGAAGPSTFDCSGLVVWAAARAGISLPRTTYAMPSSSRLYRVPLNQARPGDLLFFGSGHVELATARYHVSFGAAHAGTRVGWHTWSSYWAPTAAYRFR